MPSMALSTLQVPRVTPCRVVRRMTRSDLTPAPRSIYRHQEKAIGLVRVPAGTGGFRASVRAAAAWGRGRNRGAAETATRAEDEDTEEEKEEDEDEWDVFVHPWDEEQMRSRAGASASAAGDDDAGNFAEQPTLDATNDEGETAAAAAYRPAAAYASSVSSAASIPAPSKPMSKFADAALNVGIFSTAVLVALGVKKATDAFNSIPDLSEEVG